MKMNENSKNESLETVFEITTYSMRRMSGLLNINFVFLDFFKRYQHLDSTSDDTTTNTIDELSA